MDNQGEHMQEFFILNLGQQEADVGKINLLES